MTNRTQDPLTAEHVDYDVPVDPASLIQTDCCQ